MTPNHVFLFQKGITASEVKLGPPIGYLWRVIQAWGYVHAGSGSGTRSVELIVAPGTSSGAIGAIQLGNASGTGSNGFALAPTGAAGVGITASNLAYMPVFGHDSLLTFAATLVSGDTWDWYLTVEEVPVGA